MSQLTLCGYKGAAEGLRPFDPEGRPRCGVRVHPAYVPVPVVAGGVRLDGSPRAQWRGEAAVHASPATASGPIPPASGASPPSKRPGAGILGLTSVIRFFKTSGMSDRVQSSAEFFSLCGIR